MEVPDRFKNAVSQTFPFPAFMNNHIFAGATSKKYKKLNQTCKFIFVKQRRNCIESFHVDTSKWACSTPKKPFQRYHFYGNDNNDAHQFSSNIWLLSVLHLERVKTIMYEELMPKITRCDISCLTLNWCDDLNFDDFKMLTDSGNINTLTLYSTKIVYSDGSPVPVEKIIGQAVNSAFITINPVHITPKTMTSLLNLEWRSPRLFMLRLYKIDGILDPLQFFQFVLKTSHMTAIKSKGRCITEFIDSIDAFDFNHILSKKIKEYKDPVDVPVVVAAPPAIPVIALNE